MALVDNNYRFLYVDVGCNGRVSDRGVFRGSTLQESLEQRTANIPQPTPLPGTDMTMPFFVVADEAFPLKSYLMKPFARRGLSREQRVFNYCLSRARRIVEKPSASLWTDLVFCFFYHNQPRSRWRGGYCSCIMCPSQLFMWWLWQCLSVWNNWSGWARNLETGPSPATGSIAKVHKCK